MGTDSGNTTSSIWFRLIGRRRPLWITLGIGLLLILAPLVAAHLDGLLDDLFSQGHWRLMLGPTVVIAYILVAAPFVEQAEAGVIQAFRPLVLIEDEAFDRLVVEASRINPIGEGVAFGLGAVQTRILLACRALMARLEAEEDTGTVGAEINALVAYEKRIQETSTWPYETAMLRTLFFSVIFPAAAALARIVGEFLAG